MTDPLWLLLALVLLVPTLLVGWLRLVLKKEPSAINGWGGVLFAAMTFVAALWIILDRVS